MQKSIYCIFYIYMHSPLCWWGTTRHYRDGARRRQGTGKGHAHPRPGTGTDSDSNFKSSSGSVPVTVTGTVAKWRLRVGLGLAVPCRAGTLMATIVDRASEWFTTESRWLRWVVRPCTVPVTPTPSRHQPEWMMLGGRRQVECNKLALEQHSCGRRQEPL